MHRRQCFSPLQRGVRLLYLWRRRYGRALKNYTLEKAAVCFLLHNTTYNHVVMTCIYTDYAQCMQAFVKLIRQARVSVDYSCFVCCADAPIPGHNSSVTLRTLLWNAWERSDRTLRIRLLCNFDPTYGGASLETIAAQLPPYPHTKLKHVEGSGKLASVCSLFTKNLRYTNHHQKYLCIDGRRVLIAGSEIETKDRQGWMCRNWYGYFWHETGVELDCSPSMTHFFKQNFKHGPLKVASPFPLLTTSADEHSTMCGIIRNTRHYLHLENQVLISAPGVTQNKILSTLAQRLHKAYLVHTNPTVKLKDPFTALVVTNAAQPDECKFVTLYTAPALDWSIYTFWQYCTEQLRVPAHFVQQRVAFSTMALRRDQTYIKVHSNFVMADGNVLYRSSANIIDRSIGPKSCDSELGVVVDSPVAVTAFQQNLWKMYTDGEFVSPPAFYNMVHKHQIPYFCTAYYAFSRVLLRATADKWVKHPLLHLLATRQKIIGADVGQPPIQWTSRLVAPPSQKGPTYQSNSKRVPTSTSTTVAICVSGCVGVLIFVYIYRTQLTTLKLKLKINK